MSEGAQFESLKAKHAELETALNADEHKLQPDPQTVADIKKQKLLLKDKMALIEAGA
jgi:hypothetical protein